MQLSEDYKKEKLTIDIYAANAYGILILTAAILVFGLPFFLLWKDVLSFHSITFYKTPFTTFFIMIAGIVVHELIHGIMWMIMARKGFSSIKFGIMLKMLTPYCHCKVPLTVVQYGWGCIMPAVVLGFIPVIVAIVIGNVSLLIFGIVFTMAATGDFMIIYSLRNEDRNAIVEDHPSEGGCFVYRPVKSSDQP